MLKNKFFNLLISTVLVLFLLVSVGVVEVNAKSIDSNLPDNVKITTSPDGSTTTVIINSKPGFTTNVQTVCENGKCTNSATSTVLTSADIQKMQDAIKKRQESMEKFWKMQDEFFKQQQKMFQDLWGVNWF